MRPEKPSDAARSQLQLFQARLDSQLDMNHPLVILAGLIEWDNFHEPFASLFCPDNGAPALPVRLMVGLEILKYTSISPMRSLLRVGLRILAGNIFVEKFI